jgi:MFS family permease
MAQNQVDDVPSKYKSPAFWPRSRKWAVVLTACLVCFVVGINSTAVLSAAEEISSDFNVDIESFDNSYYMVTAWNAGAAVMPLILLPLMEDYGTRPCYLCLYSLFTIFVIVQAVAPNFATMIVSRVIAGSCAGTLQNVPDGLAADVWGRDKKRRSISISLLMFALIGGVTIGPVVGGVIIKTLAWRW